jgi:transposase
MRDYLRPFRGLSAAPPAAPAVPKVRRITTWTMRHPEDLDDKERQSLKEILASCPHLEVTSAHVTTFAKMLVEHRGENLDDWLRRVEADDLPCLRRFVRGIRRDYDAVVNGLTLPHSSGAVEGNVNRFKMIKRKMFGRPNFDLLRKLILHPA